MKVYEVTKIETIAYSKEYTADELIEHGFPAEVFTDGDLTADFCDVLAASTGADARWWLEEDIDRHGDVQGSDFTIRRVQ